MLSTRLIVVANRTCPCPGLVDEVAARLDGTSGEVHVVAPALNSRLRHWVSDVDRAIADATERLGQAVALLRDAGFAASGEVGDSDPVVAIEDALHAFPADSVLVSTWPAGRSNWLEKGLIERARLRLPVAVEHVVSIYGVEAAPGAASTSSGGDGGSRTHVRDRDRGLLRA